MLSRRWLLNSLLLVFIGFFVWAGNHYLAGTRSRTDDRITSLKLEDIHSVSVQAGGEDILLRHSGNRWRLEKPFHWPASDLAVERLISIATTQADSRLAANDTDLATFGLDNPEAVLTLNDTRLLFGAVNNIGARRYIMNGDTIYLLQDLHLHFINQGISGLIDRRLLPRSTGLFSLNLANLSLTRDGEGVWHDDTADMIASGSPNQLVNHWQTLEAGGVKPWVNAGGPQQSIVARLDDGSQIEFWLIASRPEVIIARPDLGLQYRFAEKHFDDLFPPDEQGLLNKPDK